MVNYGIVAIGGSTGTVWVRFDSPAGAPAQDPTACRTVLAVTVGERVVVETAALPGQPPCVLGIVQ